MVTIDNIDIMVVKRTVKRNAYIFFISSLIHITYEISLLKEPACCTNFLIIH